MAKLIFDIETAGDDFDSYDTLTQHTLTKWAKNASTDNNSLKRNIENIKTNLGLSPLTGSIVSVGVFDVEKNRGAVYFQGDEKVFKQFEDNNITYKQMTEEDMLKNFWDGAMRYDEFISFNGRSFDVPFILVRSAVHNIKPTKDLMASRFLRRQKLGAKHIDLLDQLTFYGATGRRGAMHMWCKVFGIKSPKQEGVEGEDVGRLFKEKRFKDIAHYNATDLLALLALYKKWDTFINFENKFN